MSGVIQTLMRQRDLELQFLDGSVDMSEDNLGRMRANVDALTGAHPCSINVCDTICTVR